MGDKHNSCFSLGEQLDKEQLDENMFCRNSLDTLMSELSEAGIMQEFLSPVSAFLYSAYINRLPLLLAGPYGQNIADALSASLFGCRASSLNCSGDFNPDILAEAENSEADIIVIQNIFSNGWLIPLLEYIQQSKKYFIALHPFTEDLIIEPKSLFNYFHPLFTELFMGSMPSGLLVGGRNLSGYEPFTSAKSSIKHPLLNSLYKSQLYISRMEKVLNDAEQMSGSSSPDLSFLCCYFPYSCCIGMSDFISDEICSSSGISKALSKKFINFTK